MAVCQLGPWQEKKQHWVLQYRELGGQMLEKLKRQKGNTEVIKVITAGSSLTPQAGGTKGGGQMIRTWKL